MNINGSGIGAATGVLDKEALRKRQANQQRIAKKKEEGQKRAVKILTDAMENGTSMVDARKKADTVLASAGSEIIEEYRKQVKEHIQDVQEKNQKKAQELKEKKQEKEERKRERKKKEAIRKRRLVLKRVLVPVIQEPETELEAEIEDTAEISMKGVYRYVLAVNMPTVVDVGDLLDAQV